MQQLLKEFKITHNESLTAGQAAQSHLYVHIYLPTGAEGIPLGQAGSYS